MDTVITKDSNGNELQTGDAVLITKTLKVKGAASDLKRGTVVKNIRTTDDPKAIEARIGGSVIVIKTEFVKKH